MTLKNSHDYIKILFLFYLDVKGKKYTLVVKLNYINLVRKKSLIYAGVYLTHY